MRLGRPTPPLTLTDDERETLGQWARRPKTARWPSCQGRSDTRATWRSKSSSPSRV